MRTYSSFVILLRACSCVIPALFLSAPVSSEDSVALDMRKVAGARVYVITADLNDPRIVVEIAIPTSGLRHSESFGRFVKRASPVAAVTGTYFDTRTLLPVGSIITGGKTLHESAIGTAVCFMRPNGVQYMSAAEDFPAVAPQSYTVRFIDKRKGEACDWSGVDCGVRTGPRLLSEGRYVLDPRKEGFRHFGLFGRRVRMAMGLTANNKLLLVAVRTPATFGHTATIMKALGAMDAVCLDGGSSSAMYYCGRLVCSPGRALTNVIQIRFSEPAGQTVAVEPARFLGNIVLQATQGTPTGLKVRIRRSPTPTVIAESQYEQHAVLVAPVWLRLARNRRAVGPIDGTQLAGLKGPKHSWRLVS